MENAKNFYLARRQLAELKCREHESQFTYYVGNFILRIQTDVTCSHNRPLIEENTYVYVDDNILKHTTVEVYPYEVIRGVEQYITLDMDPRFKNYEPIRYAGPYDRNVGSKMPINALCELIKYLSKLSDLSAFA